MHKLNHALPLQQLVNALDFKANEGDGEINYIASMDDVRDNCLTFARTTENLIPGNYTVICNPGNRAPSGVSLICSSNPRLDFIKALDFIFKNIGIDQSYLRSFIHPTSIIADTAIVESGVVIGANTVISHNVVIRTGTTIGDNCLVQPGAILGEEGFGFEQDTDKTYIKMHHLGGLKIGNNVQIGANSTLCRGTLTDTVIGDGVKIDNLVHIGHNCQMGKNVIVTACVELGGIKIEDNVWIGPNSCIREKLIIGEEALIGLGSVVVKDVEKNTIVAGNPARMMRSRN